jgi:hypothetical protein
MKAVASGSELRRFSGSHLRSRPVEGFRTARKNPILIELCIFAGSAEKVVLWSPVSAREDNGRPCKGLVATESCGWKSRSRRYAQYCVCGLQRRQ